MMNKLINVLLILSVISCNIEKDKRQSSDTETESRKPSQSPVMGWASWNNYRVDISEEIIKSQADAMLSSKLNEVGYSYINIDDGFFGGRDRDGKLLVHKDRFPSGMKSLSSYIHSKGLKAGIYSDAGINTCASYWDKDTIGSGMGLYGHEDEDLELYLKEWDYDFIKVDWCGGQWLDLDEEIQFTKIGEKIKKLKPDVKYNVCRWKFPGTWVTQIADSWRISGDIDNTFESILRIIDLNSDLWIYASSGHYNDMDMLQVGRGMSYEEDKSHFTMWAMMHSPLLLGNDLTTISNETLEIITNQDIIALNQSSFVYQARRLLDFGDMEVWAKPLVSSMSGEIAIALLNRSENSNTVIFNVDSVGLNVIKGYTIKDLWTKESLPLSYEKEISREVPGHGIVVLRMKGESLPFNVFQFKD